MKNYLPSSDLSPFMLQSPNHDSILQDKRNPILHILAPAVINQVLLLGTDHNSEEFSFMIHRHQAFLRIAMNLIAYSILGGSLNLIVEVCWRIQGIEAVTFKLCIEKLVCKP